MGHYKYKKSCKGKDLQKSAYNCPAQNLSNTLRFFLFFSCRHTFSLDKQHCGSARRAPSVWINSTAAAESADREAPSVWINSTASRSTDYLSKSRSRKVFEPLLAEVTLLSFLGIVRCYELHCSAYWPPSGFMIGYSQVSFRVRHSDGRTTFTIKTYITFEYLCPYTLVSIRRAYTLTNIITVTESGSDDL